MADREEVLKEYYWVQAAVESTDTKSFQIKSWSVTVATGAAGAAFLENEPLLLLLAGGASCVFWLTDALWKSFQMIWRARGDALELMLSRGDLSGYTGPAIHAHFKKSFKSVWSWIRVGRCLFKANVYLPHIVTAAISFSLYFVQTIGWTRLRDLVSSLG